MRCALLILIMLAVAPVWAGPSVVDDYGRRVSLPGGPARRVVSLAPHLTELMFAAGAGARLVGVLAHSDFPPQARHLPQVGSEAAIDLEAVIALRPDLVIAWPQAGSRRAIDRLEAFGIPVYRSEPRRLEDVPTTIERLGALAATTPVSDPAAGEFRRRVEALRARYASRPSVRIVYQIWDRPIVTVNGAHIISAVMRLCGGENALGHLPVLAPEIDRETVLAANPEVIVASGSDARRPGWLDAWRAYPGLVAGQRGNLYALSPDLIQRHTPRILDGAERLCLILENARRKRSPRAG